MSTIIRNYCFVHMLLNTIYVEVDYRASSIDTVFLLIRAHRDFDILSHVKSSQSMPCSNWKGKVNTGRTFSPVIEEFIVECHEEKK